jgi:hypothetical protein
MHRGEAALGGDPRQRDGRVIHELLGFGDAGPAQVLARRAAEVPAEQVAELTGTETSDLGENLMDPSMRWPWRLNRWSPSASALVPPAVQVG